MLRFGDTPPRRRPSLTPMIDVVFLLLVFFMLASRFGIENHLPLTLTGASQEARYDGPPRLLDVTPEGLRLNGAEMTVEQAVLALQELTKTAADPIVLRGRDGATLQDLVVVMDHLRAAGFTAPYLVE